MQIGVLKMNKYIKSGIDVYTESKDWMLIKTSSFYKKECKKEKAEIEIIDSYISCMENLANIIRSEARDGMCILKIYSLCIPYLFVCRHSLELIIKRYIESKSDNVCKGHNISYLWSECKNINEDKKLNYYNELIKTMNHLDSDGTRFRYVKDKEGKEYENEPVFINYELIKEDIIKLKNDLL